jgi:hypothetical protein
MSTNDNVGVGLSSDWNGQKTLSIDGTGNLASVDLNVARNIVVYIYENLMKEGTIIDFGSGMGLFQKFCEENTKFKVWSVEGYSDINFQANRDNWLIKNLGLPFEKSFENKFDLVTSFECIEHIHSSEQETFWNNVFLCSNQALVSIHTENGEGPDHCFVRKQDWWENYFNSKGYEYKVLGSPSNPWPFWPQADCSIVVYLKKNK